MASQAEKLLITHGILAKIETSYGAGGSPTGADDAILVEERVEVTPMFNVDGERSPGTGQGGRYLKVAPGGRHAEFTVPVLGRGSNVAYAADEFPDDVHVFLRASGHSVVTDATPSSESQTYTPDTTPDGSVVIEAYTRAEKFTLAGVLGSMAFAIDGPSFTRFDFECQGILEADPTDAVVPALTIASHQPPKAESIGLFVGDYVAPRVKGVRFTQNLNLAKRNDVNAATGFAGIAQGYRDPILEIDLEATALQTTPFHKVAGLDPYALMENATVVPVGFTVGGTQYNTFTFAADYAQLIDVSKAEEGEVALWTLKFGLAQSAPGADDDYSFVFD